VPKETFFPSAIWFFREMDSKVIAEIEVQPLLLDLTDELLVASTLLAIMAAPEGNKPMLLEMCASSVERCQELVEKLIQIDRRLMSEGEK
jgi:hypothetical protein